jgi:ribonuclease E
VRREVGQGQEPRGEGRGGQRRDEGRRPQADNRPPREEKVPVAAAVEAVAALTAPVERPGAEVPVGEEEGGRRRRRGRGRGRGDRGERGAEGAQEVPAEAAAAMTGEAAEPGVAVPPAAEPPVPVIAETRPQAAPTVAPTVEAYVEATPLPHAPQVIASFAPPPATYRVVSEHEPAVEDVRRPVRRRRHEDGAPVAAEPLQLVETAGDKVVAMPVAEEEAPRRPVRRRRHAAASSAPQEPLQLVETAPGAAVRDAGSQQP